MLSPSRRTDSTRDLVCAKIEYLKGIYPRRGKPASYNPDGEFSVTLNDYLKEVDKDEPVLL